MTRCGEVLRGLPAVCHDGGGMSVPCVLIGLARDGGELAPLPRRLPVDQGGGVLRIATFRTRVFNPAVTKLRAPDDDGKPTTNWPRPTMHDLRHTAASLAISAGANVKAVQMMLGHKSAALTLDTYADLFPDDLAVADALDTAVRALGISAADALRTGDSSGA